MFSAIFIFPLLFLYKCIHVVLSVDVYVYSEQQLALMSLNSLSPLHCIHQ